MACTLDFRRLHEGLGGQRNKHKREPEPEPDAALHRRRPALLEAGRTPLRIRPVEARPHDRPTYDGVIVERVSCQKWKQVCAQRASAACVSRRSTTLEVRNKEKEMKKAYRERMNDLKEEIRTNKVEKRKKREEREKRKKENILKSGTKLQKITNPKTLKKISKSKERKLLKVVPDEMVSDAGGRMGKKKELVL
ncbi:uncharacterized protein M6B38_286175 [Iris pallida]|uniref:Coiled-coil domain-containing protein 86 n=1 Tax=Iris pallida TaxID=29817 RepID=A0AAX6HX80_IRIPA|nr:uncharacterized protein M6B38_286175 [Iris pallida]